MIFVDAGMISPTPVEKLSVHSASTSMWWCPPRSLQNSRNKSANPRVRFNLAAFLASSFPSFFDRANSAAAASALSIDDHAGSFRRSMYSA